MSASPHRWTPVERALGSVAHVFTYRKPARFAAHAPAPVSQLLLVWDDLKNRCRVPTCLITRKARFVRERAPVD